MSLARKLRARIGDGFEAWGELASRHPLKLAAVACALLGGLCAGVPSLSEESRSEYLWTPTSTKAYHDWRFVEDTFGVENDKLLLYLRPADGGNALTYDVFSEALKAHLFTTEECEGTLPGTKTSVLFDDACKKEPDAEECAVSNFLAIWDYNADKLTMFKDFLGAFIDGMHNTAVNASTFAGGLVLEKDEDTGLEKVKEATSIVLIYTLADRSDKTLEFERAWNRGIVGALDREKVVAARVSPRVVREDLAAHAALDVPKYMNALIVLAVLFLVLFGPLHSLTRARPLIGVAALSVAALTTAAGYGVCALSGVQGNPFTLLLLLVLLVVHAHSSAVLVDAISAQPKALTVSERVGGGLRASGLAVFAGYVGAAAALLTGLHTDMPGVWAVCAFGAASLGLGAVGSLALLLPLVALDEHRAAAGRLSCLPCVLAPAHWGGAEAGSPAAVEPKRVEPNGGSGRGGGTDNAPTKPPPQRSAAAVASTVLDGGFGGLLADGLAPLLLRLPVALLVVAAFGTLAGLAGAYVGDVRIGIAEADALPPTSQVHEVLAMEELFGGRFLLTSVVLDGVDWSDATARFNATRGVSKVDELDFLFYRYTGWWEAYENGYLPAKGKAKIVEEDGRYTEELQAFLDEEANTLYQDDVSCDGECGVPSSSRFQMLMSRGLGSDAAHLHGRRDAIEVALAKKGVTGAFAFNPIYLTTAVDEVIFERALVQAAAAVGALGLIVALAAPASAAVWTVLCMAMAVVDLLGVLVWLAIPLTYISHVCVVMGTVLAALPAVHMSLTFASALERGAEEHSASGGAREAARTTLRTTGSSILKGACAAIIAVALLAPSESVAFVPFFKLIACAIAIGALHALLVLPALLAVGSPRVPAANMPAATEPSTY